MSKRYSLLTKMLFFVLSVFILSSSCTDDKYYTEEIWIDNPTQFRNIYQTVKKEHWVWSKYGTVNGEEVGVYHYEVSVPEITSKVAKEGAVQVALDLGSNEYRVMPYTLTYEPGIYETLDYEYGVGFVDIFFTQSDLVNMDISTMTFKITIVYNE